MHVITPTLTWDACALCHDHAGSGEIDVKEFLALLERHDFRSSPSAKEVEGYFAVFDRNKDGHVDAAELVHLLCRTGEPLTDEDVEHLMKEVRADGDRRINIQQFVAYMLATSS